MNPLESFESGKSEQELKPESNQSSVLEARNIVKYFDHNGQSVLVLDNINLDVKEGDFVCIVGPSGCGKSTFLNILSGIEHQDSGEVLLNGKPIFTSGPERTMVFQEGALFPWLKVIDNVEFGLKIAGIPKEQREEIAKRYLDMMQLTKFADSYTYQLSTGMKQRVAIARAFAMDPQILLMDEPFAALDSQTRDLLLVELQLIWKRTKKTIIFVTHNILESVILGNKVEVFKHRPSKIKKEIVINYQRPRLAEDQNLVDYQRAILKELQSEVKEQVLEDFQ